MDKILLRAGPRTLLLGLLGNMAIGQTGSPVTLIHDWDAGKEPPIAEAARIFHPCP